LEAIMQPSTEQILQSALALPSEERFQLIEALIAAEQASPPFDESWREVIQRRSAEIDTGSVKEVHWSEVRQRLRRRIGLDG
jgi:putative addiction module component (TIGR02574 family)